MKDIKVIINNHEVGNLFFFEKNQNCMDLTIRKILNLFL